MSDKIWPQVNTLLEQPELVAKAISYDVRPDAEECDRIMSHWRDVTVVLFPAGARWLFPCIYTAKETRLHPVLLQLDSYVPLAVGQLLRMLLEPRRIAHTHCDLGVHVRVSGRWEGLSTGRDPFPFGDGSLVSPSLHTFAAVLP